MSRVNSDALMSKDFHLGCPDASACLFWTDCACYGFQKAAVSGTLNCQAFFATDSCDSFAFQTSHYSLAFLSNSSCAQSLECAAMTRAPKRGCTWQWRRWERWTYSTDWRRCPWLTRSPLWMDCHRRPPSQRLQTCIHFDCTPRLAHLLECMIQQGGTWASHLFLDSDRYTCNHWNRWLWRTTKEDRRETPWAQIDCQAPRCPSSGIPSQRSSNSFWIGCPETNHWSKYSEWVYLNCQYFVARFVTLKPLSKEHWVSQQSWAWFCLGHQHHTV